MAVTRNRPKSASVSKTAIDQVGSLLQDLSAKPKEEMSIREAINQLRSPIQGAMVKGYNYDDIVKILADAGIPTTVATVKRYISLGNPPKRKGAATKGRAKRTAETEVEAPAPAAKPGRKPKAAAPAEEAPKSGRGRRKSTAVEEPAPKASAKTTKTASTKRASAAKATPKAPTRGRKKAI